MITAQSSPSCHRFGCHGADEFQVCVENDNIRVEILVDKILNFKDEYFSKSHFNCNSIFLSSIRPEKLLNSRLYKLKQYGDIRVKSRSVLLRIFILCRLEKKNL